jgi:hypothetical protein
MRTEIRDKAASPKPNTDVDIIRFQSAQVRQVGTPACNVACAPSGVRAALHSAQVAPITTRSSSSLNVD